MPKIVTSFEDLDFLGSEGVKKKATARKVKTTPSPVALQIRQQILNTDNVPKNAKTVSPKVTDASYSSSRQRMERNIHRLGSKSPRSPLKLSIPTPTEVNQTEDTTFTPSPMNSSTTTTKLTPLTITQPGVDPRKKSNRKVATMSEYSASTNKKNDKRLSITPTMNTIRRVSKISPINSAHGRTPLNCVANSASESDGIATRRNLDKRSARLRYARDFTSLIVDCNVPDTPKISSPSCKSIHAFVRKRPMFSHEEQRGDFNVVSMGDNSDVIVYRTQMAADMNTKIVQPVVFNNWTKVFDSDVSSEQVYQQVFFPLVERVLSQQSRSATLMMFGQTGSGKTYTMSACQRLLGEQLFSHINTALVQSLELAGKACRDLLSDDEKVSVQIQEQLDGSVHYVNALAVDVGCAEDLAFVLETAISRRATQSTLQNDVSSRSHAIYQIRLANGGLLTLVDCAGTERKNDSIYHDKHRQAESAEINASIYALKECIRASQKNNAHIPFRSNLLTRVLRESLVSDSNSLAIIATVAPNATDTEHTLETLKTVSTLIAGNITEGEPKKSVEDKKVVKSPMNVSADDEVVAKGPKQWSRTELMEWMARKRLLRGVIPANMDGRSAMRMSKLQLRSAFYDGDANLDRAEALYKSLRAENDRVLRLDMKRRFTHQAATAKQ